MTNPLLSLLADASARLERADRKVADAERERDIARAQVSAFQEAARVLDAVSGRTDTFVASSYQRILSVRESKIDTAPDAWARVFGALWERHAENFGYDDICSVADNLGVPYKRDSLRTKMMNYANGKMVERLDSGRFRITEKGKAFFAIADRAGDNEQREHRSAQVTLGFDDKDTAANR